MYTCPKCSSTDTYKERINGSDTGDRICESFEYTTSAVSFGEKDKEEAK
jgi:hypothetical protein